MTKNKTRMEIVSGLNQNTTYYFAIKSSFNGKDWSSFSDIPSTTIPNGTNDSVDTPTIDLSIGKTDTQVGVLQKFLAVKGFYIGPITNHFGNLTKSAVIDFQKKNNINPALGFVGKVTRNVMTKNVTKLLN